MGLTLANARINKFAPHHDRLIYGSPMLEQSGSSIAHHDNAGTFNSELASSGGWGITGTLSATTGKPFHPYVDFTTNAAANRNAASGYITGPAASAGQTWVEWTLLVGFVSLAAQSAQTLFIWHRGGTSGIAGHAQLARVANTNTLRYLFRDAANNQINLDATINDWSVPHLVAVTGGVRRGLQMIVDGVVVASNANTDAFAINSSEAWKLGTNAANQYPGYYDFFAYGLYDRQWTEDEIMEWMNDPSLPHRGGMDDAAHYASEPGQLAIPKANSIEICMCTGRGPLSFTTHLNFRARYGTSRTSLNGTATAVPITDSTKEFTRHLLVIAGLTANTEYFIELDYTADGGTTWTRMATRMQRFRTDPGVGGTVKFALWSDPHLPNAGGGGVPDPVTVGFGAAEFALVASARRKMIAADWAERDVLAYKPDLVIKTGDVQMLDSAAGGTFTDRNPDYEMRCVAQRRSEHLTNCAAPELEVDGNHEAIHGYCLDADDAKLGAFAKQAVRTLKAFRRNPGPGDYAYGGENEGPAAIGRSWLPALGQDLGDRVADSAWFNTHAIAANNGNGSPRETWGHMRYGPVDLFFCDVHSYTEIGDPQSTRFDPTRRGDRRRNGPLWTLGDGQFTWLESSAALSKSQGIPHRIILLHNLMGYRPMGVTLLTNGVHYGRELGTWLRSTSPGRRLWAIAKRDGALIVHGHDHHYGLVEVDGVWVLSLPTVSAPSLTSAPDNEVGWDHAQKQREFGTSKSGPLGSPNILDDLGRVMPEGLKRAYNILGWVALEASPTQLLVRVRQTDFTRGGAAANGAISTIDDLSRSRLAERWIGPSLAADGSGVATLTEPYRQIGFACKSSEIGVDIFGSRPGTDRKPAVRGWAAYPWDQCGTTTPTITGAVSENVQVLNVPRWLAPGEGSSLTVDITPGYGETAEAPVASNVQFREIVLAGGVAVPLLPAKAVGNVTVRLPSTNADPVTFAFDGGTPADLRPGWSGTFEDVDANKITVIGSNSDVVEVSWQSMPRMNG